MSKYSNMLYRCPGANRGPGGHTYDWVASSSEDENSRLLKEGWFLSLNAAVKAARPEGEDATGAAPLDPALTIEERAVAAKKALALAAEETLAANKVLMTDAQAVAAAEKELADATREAIAADAERANAEARARTATASKAQFAERVKALNRALSLSKTHADAARRVLEETASQKLAADQLLAGANAAEEALAAAAKPSRAARPAGAAKPTLDDVKAALTGLKDEVNAKAVTKLLKQFGVAAAPELSEDKYTEVLAAIEKEMF